MPAQSACPIVEVDRALSSYINTREDTLKIRRTISRYVTSSLRPVTSATQNHHLNHECPPDLNAANTSPPGLKDSRLRYLQALRARSQAQTKRRELQTALQALQERHVEENPTQPRSDHDNDAVRGYVSLLRQRRRAAELQVIQDSLDSLLNARPLQSPLDPKVVVKDSIGEQPDLPAERLEQISQGQDYQTGIFKLKQEVLESKAAMERAQAARQKAQDESQGQLSLQAQVFALERARDEMHEWVQGELAKLEEDSIFLEDASPVKRSVSDFSAVDIASAETQIRNVYDKYTSSRAYLIEAYKSFQQPPQPQVENRLSTTSVKGSTKDTQVLKSSLATTKILPHLCHLTQITNEERSLVQQSVYLQAQLTSADQEIEEALLRLSGESHLLPAGSKDVSAWGKTASEAELATEKLVNEHLQAIKQDLSSVSTILELSSLQSKILASA